MREKTNSTILVELAILKFCEFGVCRGSFEGGFGLSTISLGLANNLNM